MNKTTFIYGLIDPRTQYIRYVGKSNNPYERTFNIKNGMIKSHIQTALDIKNKTYKANWIRQLLKEDLKPEIIILQEVPVKENCNDKNDKEHWQYWEIYWINLEKEKANMLGYKLTNTSIGGKGGNGGNNKGYNQTKESREKMSKNNAKFWKSHKMSDEHKRKIGFSVKKLWKNSEYRDNQIKKHIGRIQTETEKMNRIKTLLPILKSDKYRENMSKVKTGHYSSKETNKKISNALKGIIRGPMSEQEKLKRKISNIGKHNPSIETRFKLSIKAKVRETIKSFKNIMQLTGLKPGKQLGDLKKSLEDKYLENPKMTDKEATDFILKVFNKMKQ